MVSDSKKGISDVISYVLMLYDKQATGGFAKVGK